MRRSTAVTAVVLAGVCVPGWAQTASGLAHDLTITSMFQQADWVVKLVMVVLVLASITTLSIWIYKTSELIARRRSIAKALASLTGGNGLMGIESLSDPTTTAMVDIAVRELQRHPVGSRYAYSEGIKERTAALIQRVEAAQQRKLSRGASVLGSIGAAAPFIGLFGTVWGIMRSFIGIAQSQTTNLAVVAPGIAEALLATAFGLVAAIPAVLIYNGVTRAIAGYRVRMSDAATEVMCLLSRELESDIEARRKMGPPYGV